MSDVDKRIGEVTHAPNPKCPNCAHYMMTAFSFSNEQLWHCVNCDAQFKKNTEGI